MCRHEEQVGIHEARDWKSTAQQNLAGLMYQGDTAMWAGMAKAPQDAQPEQVQVAGKVLPGRTWPPLCPKEKLLNRLTWSRPSVQVSALAPAAEDAPV